MGYARAVNLGVKQSKGEFLVILNPDTSVSPEWLTPLVRAARHYPEAAFLQPRILMMDDPRVLNSAGNMIHLAGFGVCRGLGVRSEGMFQDEARVCYASGACIFARKSALKHIGLMEELFHVYGEDKDWGWRALMMGWRSYFIPDSVIYHKWSPTFGHGPDKFYLLEFERITTILKNYSKRTLVLFLLPMMLVEAAVLLHSFLNGWCKEKIRSYTDVLRLRDKIRRKRRVLQASRVVDDRTVVQNFINVIEHPYLGLSIRPFNRIFSAATGRLKSLI